MERWRLSLVGGGLLLGWMGLWGALGWAALRNPPGAPAPRSLRCEGSARLTVAGTEVSFRCDGKLRVTPID